MLRSYGELFRARGAWAFSLTGFVARLPISMISISVVLLVQRTTGRYALAGAITAVATLAGAVVMPQIARLVDRRGQSLVTRPVIAGGAAGMTLTILAVTLDWPVWTWFVFAALAGASEPSIGALVRARWTHVLPDTGLRQRAFSWESSIDEVVFILGPPIATLLATGVAPYAGLLAAAVILLAGGLTFTAQRSTEPAVHAPEVRAPRRALVKAPLLCLAAVLVCNGATFGSIEIIVVGYTEERGSPGAAGLVLAAYAAGSLLAGLVFGVLTPLLLLTPGLLVLTLLIFVCGVSVAPVLISSTLVIERIVAPSALTEALTWSVTCIILGVTAGTAVAGPLIDAFGARPAFLVPAVGALVGGVIAVLGRHLFTAQAVEASATTDLPFSEVDAAAPVLDRPLDPPS